MLENFLVQSQENVVLAKMLENFLVQSQENVVLATTTKSDKAERARGLGGKRSQETGKWNQLTALRFQTGGNIQTFGKEHPKEL